MIRLCLSWPTAVLVLAAWAGAARADELKVARSEMLVPSDLRMESIDLPSRDLAGDGALRLERKLARLQAPGTQAASHLVVETVRKGSGRFEWSESCKALKPSAKVFVYSPFHAQRDYCVLVQGPYDLRRSLENLDAQAAQSAEQQRWDLGDEGYLVHVSFAISSGALMSVLALLPTPFAGLPVTDPVPSQGSAVPDGVIAWALSLGQEVQTSVLSLSGKWQLPPIKQQ